MKYITAILAILTIIEFMIILMLYFRVIRMTAEIVYQQEQITDLQMDLHSVLNDRDMICDSK
jgi:hypothetical protein